MLRRFRNWVSYIWWWEIRIALYEDDEIDGEPNLDPRRKFWFEKYL